jgi:hypothetical protein
VGVHAAAGLRDERERAAEVASIERGAREAEAEA